LKGGKLMKTTGKVRRKRKNCAQRLVGKRKGKSILVSEIWSSPEERKGIS